MKTITKLLNRIFPNKNFVFVHGDFETYSECDLKKCGAYVYAMHPSTDALCFCYQYHGEDEVYDWLPGDPYPFEDEDVVILAFNSQFERLIWNRVMVKRYGWPELPIERFICESAHVRVHAGPSALDKASLFFDAPVKKNMAGHRLMLKMCRPATEKQQEDYIKRESENKLEGWEVDILYLCGMNVFEAAKRAHHTPEDIDALVDYCCDDVLSECDTSDMLEPWRAEDLQAFWDNERINDRGIIVDTDFAKVATDYVDEEKKYFTEELQRMTNGQIKTPRQFAKLKEWIAPRVSEEVLDELVKYDKGEKKFSLNAENRQKVLDMYHEDPEFMPWEVAELIDIVDQAGNSTVSKYQAILNREVEGYHDNQKRIHGSYMFAGAAQTMRFSSTGLQIHNLNRDVPKTEDAYDIIEAFMRGNENRIRAEGHPVKTLSRMIRPTFTGNTTYDEDLIWCDWSAIEARILPWLANDPRAALRLRLFESGEDLYIDTAAKLLGKRKSDITKDERQTHGKVPELALGFGGGAGAFTAMAHVYGANYSQTEVTRIIGAWREENAWAADKKSGLWVRLERAAMQAIIDEGRIKSAGRVKYLYDGGALGGMGALWCILPSGRRLCYPDARIENIKLPWGPIKPGITCRKGAWFPKQGTTKWPRQKLWYGLLAENPTQAVSADILSFALHKLRDYEPDITVCAHTHDEIICEAKPTDENMQTLVDVMETNPPWAAGLPLAAEVEAGYRYKLKEYELC